MTTAIHGIGIVAPEKIGADGIGRVQTTDIETFVPKKKLRRVDHFSRMALLAAGKALKDAGEQAVEKDRTGILLATGFGALQTTFSFLDSYIDNSDALASPTHFSNSVHNAAAAHISICYGIRGPALTVSRFDMSFFSALITAQAWLETGKVETVLLGAVEAWCDVTGYCIDRFSEKNGGKRYTFGESAVVFVLKKDDASGEHAGFRDLVMDNYEKNGLQVPDGIQTVLSPSSLNACSGRFGELLDQCTNPPVVRDRQFSPVDISLDAAFAARSRETCCIKLGTKGEYARVTVVPTGS